MAKEKKFYVVWSGREPGIYHSWDECKKQVENQKNAKYKSFSSLDIATEAYNKNYIEYIIKKDLIPKTTSLELPIQNSICVDAACSVAKEKMEYRGVFLQTKKVLFHKGPFFGASNNIGEFLAIVHALAYMKNYDLFYPVYTDSVTAMSWIFKKHVKTQIITSSEVETLIQKALGWLQKNEINQKIIKWKTKEWGEIPADFGRK